jgi:hypothetical protein
VIFSFFMDRETFPDNLDEIKPRPIFPVEEIPPLPESTPSVIVPPASPEPLPDPAAATAEKAITPYKFLRPVSPDDPDASRHDGPIREAILLDALTIVARREPQTPAARGAMRDLIRRHSVECGLGF